jgi:Spy/CpxP family protein refolding chaperone
MSVLRKLPRLGAALAVLAAVAVGSTAIAGAASKGTSSSAGSNSARAPQGYGPPAGAPGNRGPGQHKPETRLTGDTAAKVKEAALAKVAGGTIIWVETDTDHGSPYEAHVR